MGDTKALLSGDVRLANLPTPNGPHEVRDMYMETKYCKNVGGRLGHELETLSTKAGFYLLQRGQLAYPDQNPYGGQVTLGFHQETRGGAGVQFPSVAFHITAPEGIVGSLQMADGSSKPIGQFKDDGELGHVAIAARATLDAIVSELRATGQTIDATPGQPSPLSKLKWLDMAVTPIEDGSSPADLWVFRAEAVGGTTTHEVTITMPVGFKDVSRTETDWRMNHISFTLTICIDGQACLPDRQTRTELLAALAELQRTGAAGDDGPRQLDIMIKQLTYFPITG